MPNIQLLLSEIPVEALFRVKSGEVALVVIHSNGRISAFEDVCPHAFWPLSQGQLSNGILECPGHAWEFSVESGQCLNAPAYCLHSVPAVVDGEFVRFECEHLTARNGRRLSQGSACASSLP